MTATGPLADDFAAWTERLARRLAEPLPGLEAQLAMAPRPRRPLAPGVDPERPIPAAVLALFFPAPFPAPAQGTRTGETCLLLTRRTELVARHKGQICLPGGVLDPGESAVDAALRECEEEVGIPRGDVRILGRLTPVFIPLSGHRMEPFVGATTTRPTFRLAASEVAEVIELPVARLVDPALRSELPTERDGTPVVIPHFAIGGREVWGATAMVLSELCAVLRDAAAPDLRPRASQPPM